MSILDGELAGEVAAALEAAALPRDLTLNERTEGVPDPPWDPPPVVWVPHACRGWSASYRADEIDGTLILATDVLVHVLLSGLAVTPRVNDQIVVDGATLRVVRVSLDPGRALAECQVRA